MGKSLAVDTMLSTADHFIGTVSHKAADGLRALMN